MSPVPEAGLPQLAPPAAVQVQEKFRIVVGRVSLTEVPMASEGPSFLTTMV